MSAGRSACLCWTLLSVCLLDSSSAEKKTIPAVPGQTVSLPCKALNNDPVRDVEWRRTDMKEDEYVLFYRDDQLAPENQHPSYKNRVDLQMKDGDVSLILNNVTIEDSGTYECRVKTKTSRRKRAYLDSDPITIISLDVVPPGHTDGDKDGSVGLIVGLIVAVAVVVVGGVGVAVFFKKNMKKTSSPPPSSSSSPPLQSSDPLLA